ncbi:IgGFc-binding protein-like [Spea bombifrons]|uniref:IgGFc-binding protein-like n=1 Tax=Spea bombifrons TaxID=233779 RepID=UPI00234BFFC1|nr:IgGFc-binding protein-like [Spea bombifrons]
MAAGDALPHSKSPLLFTDNGVTFQWPEENEAKFPTMKEFGGNIRWREGPEEATTVGKKFVTTFLQNHGADEIPQVEFQITGTHPSTQVTLTISNTDFKKEVTVNNGETVSVPITEPVEMLGTDTSPRSVVIEADHGVAVVSRSSKYGSSDTALLYPVESWGILYYIVTPPWGPDTEYKEFAIISNDMPTNVKMHLKGDVNFQGQDYPKGSILRVTLEPNQAMQIQSKDDLSGTKVEAQYPITVLSGHTCSQKNGNCGHVYEQLLPVERWGDTYFVPGLSFQPKSDIAMVMAYQPTEVEYQSGTEKGKKPLEEGEMVTFDVSESSPLSLRANNNIQVHLFGTGGISEGNPLDPFLITVPDTKSYSYKAQINGEKDIENNKGVIIIKKPGQSGITIDDKAPEGIQWRDFPGTEYSWGEFRLPSGFSFHTVKNPTMPFGLLSIGYSPNMAYGSIAPSLNENEGKFPEMKEQGGKFPWPEGNYMACKRFRGLVIICHPKNVNSGFHLISVRAHLAVSVSLTRFLQLSVGVTLIRAEFDLLGHLPKQKKTGFPG